VPRVPVERYAGIHLAAWSARTCAGDAASSCEAVREARPALVWNPERGWSGSIDDGGDTLGLATALAREIWEPDSDDEFPWLSVSLSKGDTASWLAGDAPAALLPFAAWPGNFLPRLAAALGIRTYRGTAPVAACSTGLYALLEAADHLRAGGGERGLAGTVDRSLQPLLLAGFASLGVLAGERRPEAFTGAGTGFAPAEGGAFVTLSRTGGPWRLLAGVRLGDAAHPTRCERPDTLLGCCEALWKAAPEPDAIVVHGTGTAVGDRYERAGLDAGPWRDAERVVCKPVIGHCLGASGICELALALEGPWRRFWKLSLGFGGHLAAVACERVEGRPKGASGFRVRPERSNRLGNRS